MRGQAAFRRSWKCGATTAAIAVTEFLPLSSLACRIRSMPFNLPTSLLILDAVKIGISFLVRRSGAICCATVESGTGVPRVDDMSVHRLPCFGRVGAAGSFMTYLRKAPGESMEKLAGPVSARRWETAIAPVPGGVNGLTLCTVIRWLPAACGRIRAGSRRRVRPDAPPRCAAPRRGMDVRAEARQRTFPGSRTVESQV